MLDLCPISNYKLRVFESWDDYPIRKITRFKIPCTINTDDPMSFGNFLNDEYQALHQNLDFSAEELAQIAKNGFESADLSNEQRMAALDEIDRLLNIYQVRVL